jgi:hypothetical protein
MEYVLALFAASLVFAVGGAGNASVDFYLNNKSK